MRQINNGIKEDEMLKAEAELVETIYELKKLGRKPKEILYMVKNILMITGKIK